MRGICSTRKIGHSGTLDPMATGVLPIFIGRATKAIDLQLNHDKEYEAVLLLGLKTDTGDITGQILEERVPDGITEAALCSVLPNFLGEQMQLPPMYSAVKIQGKPLYKYAREGKAVERKPRPVVIHELEYLGPAGTNRFSLRVHCSKGTYIRTLLEDIGHALGIPATLAALRRTAAGDFTLLQSHSLEEIQLAKQSDSLQKLLCPVESLFGRLPALTLDSTAFSKLCNGVSVAGLQQKAGLYRVLFDGRFIGLATMRPDRTLRAEKLFFVNEATP